MTLAPPAPGLPLESTYAPAEPVNLALTLRPLARGPIEPTFRWVDGAAWMTRRTPLGPATLRLTPSSAGIAAAAWGDGAEWAIAGVPELCGAGDDWSTLDVGAVPLLADTLRRARGLRLLRTNGVFEALVPAIFEQKVTGLEARRAWRTLVAKHGEPAPGPAPAGMRVVPSAAGWKRIPSWEWHRAGVGPQRSATVMRATSVADGLERTLALGRGGAEVAAKLRTVVGVGVWTAAETTQRSHGDPDSPSVGDYHLPAQVGWALAGAPVDDDGMLELLEPWAGQRQRIMRLIEVSGVAPPHRGPRMTVQDHRRH